MTRKTWFIDEHVTGDVSADVEATIHDIYYRHYTTLSAITAADKHRIWITQRR